MPLHRFSNPAVKAVFEAYPQTLQEPLRDLRGLILDVAAGLPKVGPIEESLKWGEPAYRPKRDGIGTTVRIGPVKGSTTRYAMFVHCRTTLAREFRVLYSKQLRIDGDRAVIFTAGEPLPTVQLTHCIALALTYHARSKLDEIG